MLQTPAKGQGPDPFLKAPMVDHDKVLGYIAFVTAAAGQAELTGIELTKAAEHLLIYAIAEYSEVPAITADRIAQSLMKRVLEMVEEKKGTEATIDEVLKIIEDSDG